MSTGHELFVRNELEELIFTDGTVIWLFPTGWAQAFYSEDEEDWHSDYHDSDSTYLGSLFGYYSESETRKPGDYLDICMDFVSIADLLKLREIQEPEAQRIHPELYAYLAAVDRGEAE